MTTFSKLRLALAGSLLLLLPTAQGQLYDLADVYPAVRDGICLLLHKPHNCPLPRDAIIPLDLAIELPHQLPKTDTLYVLGKYSGAAGVRTALSAHLPHRTRPLTVFWAAPRPDLKRVVRWARTLPLERTEDGRRFRYFDLKLVEVPINDQWSSAGELELVVLNGRAVFGAYQPTLKGTLWFRLTGKFASGWEPFVALAVQELATAFQPRSFDLDTEPWP